MDKFRCECCGGTINTSTYVCEYCGTHYKRDDDQVLRIVHTTNPCHVFKTRLEIPREEIEALGPIAAAEMTTKSLTRNLADAFAPFMRIETEYDQAMDRQIVTASIRVMDPDYRFM